jgi:membrane-associated phospholipid phosphatase
VSKLQRPFPPRTALIATAAGLASLLLCIFLLDRPISTWSHDVLHHPQWCKALTWLADIPVPLSVAGLAGAFVAFLSGWRPGPAGRLFLAICIGTLFAEAMKDSLKYAFGRPWPETWVNDNPSWIGSHSFGFRPFHGGAGFASFPSGHTTLITAPCAVVWRHARRLHPVCIALPLLVAIGLIGCDYHFLSDCIAGALLGIACGATVEATICRPDAVRA